MCMYFRHTALRDNQTAGSALPKNNFKSLKRAATYPAQFENSLTHIKGMSILLRFLSIIRQKQKTRIDA